MDSKDSAKTSKTSKPNKPALILVVIILIAGGAYVAYSGVLTTTVQSGDNVSVYYTGSFTNGTVFNTNVGGPTFNFTVGANEVIPGFDQAVIGMKLNQTKNITIPVNEAYGPLDPQLILEIPTNNINGTATIGETLHGYLGGQAAAGVIMSINTTNGTAKVNFNSPLAGHALVFKIRVVSIQRPSGA